MFKSASYKPTQQFFVLFQKFLRSLELSAVTLYFSRSVREAFDLRDAAVFLCKDGSSVVTFLLRCVCIRMLFSGVQFSVCPQKFTKWRACLNSLTVPSHPNQGDSKSTLSTVDL